MRARWEGDTRFLTPAEVLSEPCFGEIVGVSELHHLPQLEAVAEQGLCSSVHHLVSGVGILGGEEDEAQRILYTPIIVPHLIAVQDKARSSWEKLLEVCERARSAIAVNFNNLSSRVNLHDHRRIRSVCTPEGVHFRDTIIRDCNVEILLAHYFLIKKSKGEKGKNAKVR